MPLFLFSGLPGHGKTLRAIQFVEKLRVETGRAVFYHRIAELTLDWTRVEDPRKWMDLPDGAIVVLDECHETFPKRAPGSKVPDYVEKLAVHRHRGFDFVLITQHAQNQLDHFVRGLIDQHEHLVRLFGAERARIHRWPTYQEAPGDYHAKKESVTEIWKYPPALFGVYKSAEVHTVKRRLPWKPLVIILGGITAIGLLGSAAYAALFRNVDAGLGAVGDVAGSDQLLQQPVQPGRSQPGRSSAPASSVQYFTPTVASLPFTAPFFDPAVKVTQAPQVAGCGMIVVNAVVQCWCNSQQGSRIAMTTRQCISNLKTGAFLFDRKEDYYPKLEPYVPPLAEPAPVVGESARQSDQAAQRPTDGALPDSLDTQAAEK